MIALTFAIRHLRRNLRHTAFHVFGLAIGFLAFILIGLYVMDEWKFDRHHANFDNIYRVESSLRISDDQLDYSIAPPAVGAAISEHVPGIVAACRLFPQKGSRFFLADQTIREDRVAYADETLFKVFTFRFISGTAGNALKDLNSIVLTKASSLKYFRGLDVVGQNISMLRDDSVYIMKVTGVVEDLPATSHFQFDFFISMSSFPVHSNTNFLSFYPFSTYVTLAENANKIIVQQKTNSWIHSSIPDYQEIEKAGNKIDFVLTPLSNIHLGSHKKYELAPNSDRRYINIFSTAAVFILLMSGINFMNLSLARFARRSKESGIKKILGSSSQILSLQFVFESIVLYLIAATMAIACAWFLLPAFNEFTHKSISISQVLTVHNLATVIAVSILLGIITGIYPSITYSSLAPRHVIAGAPIKLTGGYAMPLSRILLVVQFCVSTFLITGTVIIYEQLNYIRDKDAGYQKDGIVVVQNASVLKAPKVLKEKILQLPGVTAAAFSHYLPTNDTRWSNFGAIASRNSPVETQFWPVDADYITTLNIQIIEGRNFSSVYATDSSAIILNETAARLYGAGKSILSQAITYSYRQQPKRFTVIGIVKDFHFNSFRESIGPLAFVLSDDTHANLIVRYRGDAGSTITSALVGIWNSLQPQEKVDILHLDEDFDLTYQHDTLTGHLFMIFAFVAVLLACLGLYGLTKYSIENRKKELAIRSVLGASALSLTVLLSKFYTRLIVLSVVVTLPICVFFMTRWLQDFAYRYTIHWYDYALGILLSSIIPLSVLLSKILGVKNNRLIKHITA